MVPTTIGPKNEKKISGLEEALEKLLLLTETLPVVATPLVELDEPDTSCKPPTIRFSSRITSKCAKSEIIMELLPSNLRSLPDCHNQVS